MEKAFDEMSLNLIVRMFMNWLWQNTPMIAEGTHPPVQIDFGNDEPGMTLQREYREGDYRVWRDYLMDCETVKSPVDIDDLPAGVYRLTTP